MGSLYVGVAILILAGEITVLAYLYYADVLRKNGLDSGY